MSEVADIRYVSGNNTAYLRLEDVTNLIREVASTEPIDTRNRLEELASELLSKFRR